MSEQTTERYCVLVNGHAVEPGCWVEGHWGQYGPDHLADRAEELGWCGDGDSDDYPLEGYGNDPRYWRRVADNERLPEIVRQNAWEYHVEAADKIEQWLNDHTPALCPECHQPMHAGSDGFYFHDGLPCEIRATLDPLFYSWGWYDGEFYLWSTETWEETG